MQGDTGLGAKGATEMEMQGATRMGMQGATRQGIQGATRLGIYHYQNFRDCEIFIISFQKLNPMRDLQGY